MKYLKAILRVLVGILIVIAYFPLVIVVFIWELFSGENEYMRIHKF